MCVGCVDLPYSCRSGERLSGCVTHCFSDAGQPLGMISMCFVHARPNGAEYLELGRVSLSALSGSRCLVPRAYTLGVRGWLATFCAGAGARQMVQRGFLPSAPRRMGFDLLREAHNVGNSDRGVGELDRCGRGPGCLLFV